MEMEHINENTIRVLIKSEDLAARGITFLDLLGNQNEIENFFYSILEEVDIDEEFKGSEAVTFQVLPKGDGLELFISKNLPPEEISQLEDGVGSPEEISEFLKKHVAAQLEEASEPEEVKRHFVFEMTDFEEMIQLANEVQLDSVITNLYGMNGAYFLEIEFLDELIFDSEIKDYVSYIAEFARKSHVTPEVLSEHGKLLMEHDALAVTRHYFH
ncbi:adaptor protein MecA [Enterococcus mediterraneensis]|uniref:adaptor protein MecA n=1 Tax=Enterococcus mediterraneensis TaxID=2364791 RepID=UPI000F064BEF|nr:adaptor protein MecA [Enterococcus mediterraneensis]